MLGVELVAKLAFLLIRNRGHDKFHATCFTRAVLSIAVLSEVTPFPVAASETMLVKETHIVDWTGIRELQYRKYALHILPYELLSLLAAAGLK